MSPAVFYITNLLTAFFEVQYHCLIEGEIGLGHLVTCLSLWKTQIRHFSCQSLRFCMHIKHSSYVLIQTTIKFPRCKSSMSDTYLKVYRSVKWPFLKKWVCHDNNYNYCPLKDYHFIAYSRYNILSLRHLSSQRRKVLHNSRGHYLLSIFCLLKGQYHFNVIYDSLVMT